MYNNCLRETLIITFIRTTKMQMSLRTRVVYKIYVKDVQPRDNESTCANIFLHFLRLSKFCIILVLQQRSPKVTCTHTGRVTSSIIHHFKAKNVLSSELRDATFRILCEKNYGPLNMGTVIIAQKEIMISFYDKNNTYCIKFMLLGCI